MATPNNFLNRYSPYPYPYSLPSWPLTAAQSLTFPPQLRMPALPQHFGFSYMMPPNCFAYPQHPQAINPSHALQQHTPAAPGAPRSEDKNGRLQNKNQKTQKTAATQQVIEISDDEEPPQQEKPCEEKSTSASSKLPGFQPQINTKSIEYDKKQQIAPLKKQEDKLKDRPDPRPSKTKEIFKPHSHKKKSKNGERRHQSDQKKGPVFSQRIIQKNETKREPYRLTKKQRELLEIAFLRELDNEIMTGPQFQARLPSFLPLEPSHASTLHSWKKELKASLLERVEKEEE